ncbi:YdcF family protein [Diplocloster hominis]|uniref:YdcF family protein n=1 Tax=Diplocloster hominis TaxID=3079010 RepID=UPI0031BAD144
MRSRTTARWISEEMSVSGKGMQVRNVVYEDVNQVCRFLADRSVYNLSGREITYRYGIGKADVLMVFGNDLPAVALCGAKGLRDGLADWLVFCGGVGHSTMRLRKTVAANPEYGISFKEISNASEAKIFQKIAVRVGGVDEKRILLEETSGNCSENGKNGLEVLRNAGITARSVILMQDPLMQRRSRASLEMFLTDEMRLISYAPFVPLVDENLCVRNRFSDLWPAGRFLELLLGEIPRLRDDRNGYGPAGKRFITHVDIPGEIEAAYQRLKEEFGEYDARGI